MSRQERRRMIRRITSLAKKQGLGTDEVNLDIVTDPYESDFIQVITEQSSYLIDLKNKRALRIQGDDAAHVAHDSEWYPYEDIYSCSVSFPLRMTWKDGDRLIMRTSTPITVVNELTAAEAFTIAGSLE